MIKAFTSERAAEHENAVRQIIDDVLDAVAERESFDLVADVDRPIPARVIGSLLGTPPKGNATLVRWSNVVTAFEDPEIRARWADACAVLPEIIGYVNGLIEQRRANSKDDLITAGWTRRWTVRSSTSLSSRGSSSC